LELQLPVDAYPDKHSQRRGGRIVLRWARAQEKDWPVAALGARLQAADLLRPGLR
jgi:hypothetical protein